MTSRLATVPFIYDPYKTLVEIKADDKADAALRARALNELVDALMRGEAFPKGIHRMQQINLADILDNCDQEVLVDIIIKAKNESFYDCREQLKQVVRRYVNESHWHVQMMEKLERNEQND